MAETIDQQFVEYIVKTLASEPDKVVVNRTTDDRGVLLTLEVAPDDLGRIIGKKGINAQSIRTLLRALGMKNDARYNLKIASDDDYTPAPRDEAPTAAPLTDEVSAAEPDTTDEEPTEENALAEKTRAELADLDDLDI
jgi:predicted RNA-binding protein YlqC (UPF0109 family)